MKLKMKEYLEFLKSKEREFVSLVNEQHLPLKSKIEVLGLLSGLFRGLRTLDTTEKLEKIIKDMGSLPLRHEKFLPVTNTHSYRLKE